jgi:L-amino acid N-acyltransferase YncA
MPRLFSYGTLQQDEVQQATFGRLLIGNRDELPGYEASLARIDDPREAASARCTHHDNVRVTNRTAAGVSGTVFEITDAELASADGYERRAGYDRAPVRLASGREAWVYAHPQASTGPVFRLRDVTPADVPALARLHVQTFTETHRGGRPGGPTIELRESQWREIVTRAGGTSFCFVVVDDAGDLIGFARGRPHDGGVPGFAGELNKIYVIERRHRQRIGSLLLFGVARRFVAQDVRSMLLFGDAQSPSNGFYERYGAERIYSEKGEFHGGYGWRDLRVLVEW